MQNKKGLKRFLILLAAYLPVHVVYTKIVLRFLEMPMPFSVMLQILSYLLLGSTGVVVFRDEWKAGIALWKEQTGKTLCLLLAAFVLDILLSNLAALPMMQLDPEYQSMNEHAVSELRGRFPALLLIVAFGVMGPITEEAVFRLAPMGLTEKKGQQLPVILGAAVLFMLVHLHAFTVKEVLSNLPHLATGLVYGLALLLSRNATLPVLLHMMNNLPAMVLGTL